MELHVGLGKSAKILNLEIWWPTSNTRQNFPNVTTNQLIEVKEFSKDYTRLKRTTVHLGGPKKGAAASGSKVATLAGGRKLH